MGPPDTAGTRILVGNDTAEALSRLWRVEAGLLQYHGGL
jgi:hypothetical protein